MKRYAANLLFQYEVDGRRQARPLCEKRIVVFKASSPKDALRQARLFGKRQQTTYRNADGDRFRIRLLGFIDLIDLDSTASDPREAYYSMFRTARPERLLREAKELSVWQGRAKTIRSSWWAVPRAAARSK